MEPKLIVNKSISDKREDQNLADIFEIKHYQNNYSFGPHSHKNIEINYVRNGKCYLKIDDKIISFQKGDCMILFPNVEHYFFTTNEKAVLVQLEFSLDIFPQMLPCPGLKHDLLFQDQLDSHARKTIKIRNNIEMNRIINKAVRELNDKKANFELLTRLYIAELFVLVSRELDNQFDLANRNNNPQLELVLQHIHSNYQQKIQFGQLAKNIGISSRYLRSNFGKKMGISPVAYLMEYRINRALELFKDQSLSIKEIAFDTGFVTQQYFSKKFKESVGISPKEYRNSLFRKM